MKKSGMLIDIHERNIYPAEIHFESGLITKIQKIDKAPEKYILPGLIDSHIHIESSMLTPGAFASVAVRHGTVGVVSDPHEIANVMGVKGIDFMISDGKKTPMKFWFGAPSCVPATSFETNGAEINSAETEELLKRVNIKYLSEMMNFPGVIAGDPEVMNKLTAAKSLGKPVDGHAPGLSGENLNMYISAGISTDHECSSIAEAQEKIKLGMKILIREGSAARNLDALKDLLRTDPDMVMLCSDDLHPEILLKRHLNKIIARLINEGYDIFDVIRACTVNPAKHYSLDAGMLIPGQKADFIIVDDYKKMNVEETWIDGIIAFDRGRVMFNYSNSESINKFNCSEIEQSSIVVSGIGKSIKVIIAIDGELFTKTLVKSSGYEKIIEPDLKEDILKIIVKDRYGNAPPVVGFINGFGLRKGAIASSVAHDSHNIICIGTNDSDIVCAINEIVKMKGGLSVSDDGKVSSMKLNIGGIMTNRSCEETASEYMFLSSLVKSFGCSLNAPFMTLSFMALLVIPELKIGDRGLFDGNKFCLTSLFAD
jgi:adenine deaminase